MEGLSTSSAARRLGAAIQLASVEWPPGDIHQDSPFKPAAGAP
jgi:hypothetical protein